MILQARIKINKPVSLGFLVKIHIFVPLTFKEFILNDLLLNWFLVKCVTPGYS